MDMHTVHEVFGALMFIGLGIILLSGLLFWTTSLPFIDAIFWDTKIDRLSIVGGILFIGGCAVFLPTGDGGDYCDDYESESDCRAARQWDEAHQFQSR